MDAPTQNVNRMRFLRVSWFFFRAFAHAFIFDVLLNRDGLRWLRPHPYKRYQRIARRFRHLAVDLGGVLIKLGQFLSIRVDILPPEVTAELSGLQDKIPAVAFPAIKRAVEKELGGPINEHFRKFEETPIGAASLAQVHRAELIDGREVVVKVLRPGIDLLVNTDLAATALACDWLKWYKPVASRVDLDWLVEEFEKVTRAELDFRAEAQNLEDFRQFFKDEKRLYLPEYFAEYSRDRILTMENVAWFKPAQREEMQAAGIDLDQVAQAFFDIHMQQVFIQHMVHADPHPGNLFIKPLRTKTEIQQGQEPFHPNDPIPDADSRGFQVVLVDFGMIGHIPPRLRSAIREFALGIAARDPHRMVQSYVQAGTLLPGADLTRIEELHEILLDNIWGVANNRIQEAAGEAVNQVFDDFRDIIFETRFQVQVDLLFTVRSIEIMNGMVTKLNPGFNPWLSLLPFARKLTADDIGLKKLAGGLLETLQAVGRIPKRIDRVLSQAERGALVIRNALTPEVRGKINRLERHMDNLRLTILLAALLVSGVMLHIHQPEGYWDDILLGAALLSWIKTLFRRP